MSSTTNLKEQWEKNKAQWEKLCTEQEGLSREGFAKVFEVLDRLEETFTLQHPYTENYTLIDQALKETGHATDEAFCTAFKRNNAIMIEGNRLMMENAKINLVIESENRPPERVSPEGWRFYPIHIFAPQQFHALIRDEIQQQALQGDGIFKNFTEIAERPDEALDMFLGVEVYNVKCNFQLYLAELREYRVTGKTLGETFTHNLFDLLNEIATYIKSNTDKPEGVKAHILDIVEDLDKVPIWGLIFQILILQGLISLLVNCTLKQGDEGYDEAQDLGKWLTNLLSYKVCWFAFTGALYSGKDWERLKPFCDFLYNTDIGRAVQDSIFKNEATDGGSNYRHPTNGVTDLVTPTENPTGVIPEAWRLPIELATPEAQDFFAKLIGLGLMEIDTNGRYNWKGTKKELALTAELMCERLGIPNKWKMFESVFKVKNLAQAKYKAIEIDGKYSNNEKKIRELFEK